MEGDGKLTGIGRRTYPVPAAVRERLRTSGLSFSELRVAETGKASEATIRALAAGCGCGDPEVTSWASGIQSRIETPPNVPGLLDVPGPYYGLLDDEYDGELVVAMFRDYDDDSGMLRWTGTGWEQVPDEYDPVGHGYIEIPDDEAAWFAEPLARGSRGVILRPTTPRGFLPRSTMVAAAGDSPGIGSDDAVFAIVDDLDTTAVLDLVLVRPGPEVLRRENGEWKVDAKMLSALRGVDPPRVVRVPAPDVPAVVQQVDDFDASKGKPKPATPEAEGLVSGANPPATSRMPMKLKRYWTKGEGAAKIRWGTGGDFNRCRRQMAKYLRPDQIGGACANLHKMATGTWPGRKKKHGVKASGEEYTVDVYSETDPLGGPEVRIGLAASGGPALPPRDWFEDPRLNGPTPLTVTADGRVYGHIAAWGVRHIGMPGHVTPPRSQSGYAFFRTGVVETDGGDVPVGQLTLAGGHAPLSADASAAVRHYDDTASAVADLAAGEDSYGIWVAGALRPDVTPTQVRALRASAPSGDWRPINGALELVALCQVNVPGFPVARARVASGATMALVAAGARDMAVRRYSSALGIEDRVAALETATKNSLRQRVARER